MMSCLNFEMGKKAMFASVEGDVPSKVPSEGFSYEIHVYVSMTTEYSQDARSRELVWFVG